jgi:hypothetical protein
MNRVFHHYSFSESTNIFFCIILCILILLFCVRLNAESSDDQKKDKIFNPEQSSVLYAFAGYGYYNWKMMSSDRFLDSIGPDAPSDGISFKHNADPYIVKKLGIRSNFFLFSLGFDYLGNKLSLPDEFYDGKTADGEESKKAKQLRYLSGITVDKLSFHFTITHREFKNTITSLGHTSSNGSVSDIYYYPADGSYQTVAPGEEIIWRTKYTEYEGRFAYTISPMAINFGIRQMKYDSPTEMTISETPENGDILMYTKNTIWTIFCGISAYFNLKGDLYMQLYAPVNFIGSYKMENDYFDSNSAMRKNSFSVSSNGNLSIAYIIKHLKVEGGVDYGFYFSSMSLRDVELKKEILYTDNYTGTQHTAAAGSYVAIEASRIEFFWGLYLQASAFF